MKLTELNGMVLLPPPADCCQECGRKHPPEMPHDAQSMYYQVKFNMENGRKATWKDAMAHCSPEMQVFWTDELRKIGCKEVLTDEATPH